MKFKHPYNIYKIRLYVLFVWYSLVLIFLPVSCNKSGFDRSEHIASRLFAHKIRMSGRKQIEYDINQMRSNPIPLNWYFDDRRPSIIYESYVCALHMCPCVSVHTTRVHLPEAPRGHRSVCGVTVKIMQWIREGWLIDFFYYHSPRPLQWVQYVIIMRPETREARMSHKHGGSGSWNKGFLDVPSSWHNVFYVLLNKRRTFLRGRLVPPIVILV